ncbi:hypothetical protein ACFP1I_02455 [Dyadobacter subterraneus]|uniref:Uncharacterized protein n=1 Tax=Dyadobacter subterraneus TaxID=2773304 RepID=A0ABR9W508_9BACT|nr:hypothetical protein [Dyadobacter subterraneus]MBE9460543.1 hypothetical protein [Dyadobacter subterraneus]
MPITIVSDEKKIDGHGITKKEIQSLVDNFRETFKKKSDAGDFQCLRSEYDSKSVSFTIQEVLDLLKANNFDWRTPDKYELRIYFGAHSNIPQELTAMGVPKEDVFLYLRQQTAILVLAEPIKDHDGEHRECLDDKDAVSVGGIRSDEGLEVGSLCPPKCQLNVVIH